MTKSSKTHCLDNLSREDIKRVAEKYRHDKPYLRKVLRGIFKRRSNIALFSWFISQKTMQLETPQFHKDILAVISDKSVKYIGIGAPRGHAKSTTVNFTYALWSTIHQEHKFGVIISDTVSQSVEFINTIKSELEDNILLRWLYGDLTRETEWRDGEFVTSTGVKWAAKGVGMKIRGLSYRKQRPDLMIFDDLENDEQVATAAQRKKIKNWFTRAALPALSKDGRAIIIGTILHDDSLLQNILKRTDTFASWNVQLYRAITTDENGRERALWAEHLSLKELKAMRDDPKSKLYVGSITFAQEYQNKPLDDTDLVVKPENIRWAEQVPDGAILQRTVLAIDPAVSKSESADPTGKVVASKDQHNNVYIRYVDNERRSVHENEADIRQINERYQPERIGIEQGALGLVFKDILVGLPLVPLYPHKDKTSRLISVSRFFEAGQVYFLQNAKNINELYDQLMEFPNGAHDDMVDALVYAVQMLLVDTPIAITADSFITAGDYDEPEGNDYL